MDRKFKPPPFVTLDTHPKFADQALLTYLALLVRPEVYPQSLTREPADFFVKGLKSVHTVHCSLRALTVTLFSSTLFIHASLVSVFETVSLLRTSHTIRSPSCFRLYCWHGCLAAHMICV